jgi:hypothetical protein
MRQEQVGQTFLSIIRSAIPVASPEVKPGVNEMGYPTETY